jgi:hypothetical protein
MANDLFGAKQQVIELRLPMCKCIYVFSLQWVWIGDMRRMIYAVHSLLSPAEMSFQTMIIVRFFEAGPGLL